MNIELTWMVEGAGRVEIEIGAPRIGWHRHELKVGH
jgi:hypothetical protein